MAKKPAAQKTVETLIHDADKRKNIPTAEFQSVVKQGEAAPVRVGYDRRNRDLDPQFCRRALLRLDIRKWRPIHPADFSRAPRFTFSTGARSRRCASTIYGSAAASGGASRGRGAGETRCAKA